MYRKCFIIWDNPFLFFSTCLLNCHCIFLPCEFFPSCASLQGKTGQEILGKFDLPVNDFNSFILAEGGKIYTRSTGVLRMFKLLGGEWKIFYGFIIVPKFIRNAVYNWISKHRYKWYGKRDECMVPTPELRERFLE
jgi:predicted DCC family thiol-disulfide oxidoreductase YuxK